MKPGSIAHFSDICMPRHDSASFPILLIFPMAELDVAILSGATSVCMHAYNLVVTGISYSTLVQCRRRRGADQRRLPLLTQLSGDNPMRLTEGHCSSGHLTGSSQAATPPFRPPSTAWSSQNPL